MFYFYSVGGFCFLKAARELALYFSDRQCILAKLVLSKADVDDFEASQVEADRRNCHTICVVAVTATAAAAAAAVAVAAD